MGWPSQHLGISLKALLVHVCVLPGEGAEGKNAVKMPSKLRQKRKLLSAFSCCQEVMEAAAPTAALWVPSYKHGFTPPCSEMHPRPPHLHG